MRACFLAFILIGTVCADATENKLTTDAAGLCVISYKNPGPCMYKDIKVDIEIEEITSDEKLLKSLNIINNDNKHSLQVPSQTSILEGDKGYISFSDINFDGYPDIAITTSFGLANLYLDYWVYDSHHEKYHYIGNHSKFELNHKLKILNNTNKVNAANYENNTYIWKGYNLIRK